MRNLLSRLAIVSLLITGSALAKESDFHQPMNINADQQEADLKTNTVTFSGNVEITQGTIVLTANKVTVVSVDGKTADSITAVGSPAHFHQIMDDGKPIDAYAKHIRYQMRESSITLTGDAKIQQLDSQVTSDKIRYLLDEERIIANSGNGQRVKATFTPEQFQKSAQGE